MNVLIKFEDRYGCKTLFKRSSSTLNDESACDRVDVNGGFGNCSVFDITKRMVAEYDYIIIVFDLDSNINFSLTSDELKKRISRFILDKNGNIKEKCSNKIVFIPVYFCFETLMLYCSNLRDVIRDADRCTDCEMIRIIKMYKLYYDYSIVDPDYMINIQNNIKEIRDKLGNITGNRGSKDWFPQHFHISYMKQLIKYLYRNEGIPDKIFKKSEDILFESILSSTSKALSIQDIITDISSVSGVNEYFAKLLRLSDLNSLSGMVIGKNLDRIYNQLDRYNYGLKHAWSKRDLEMCCSNLEAYAMPDKNVVSNSNIKQMIKHCKESNFDDDIIHEAMIELEIERDD